MKSKKRFLAGLISFGLLMFFGIMLFSLRNAFSAGTIALPKTGQTQSYASGDDGAKRVGVEVTGQRFQDNNDGTITDKLTGLIWLKDANCWGALSWYAARDNINNLSSGTCGLSDGSSAGNWRMPNINELDSLINFGDPNLQQWLTDRGFLNVQSGNYWTSTSYGTCKTCGWAVRITSNGIHILYENVGQWTGNRTSAGTKANFFNTSLPFVWPVRGGVNGNPDPTYPANIPKTGQISGQGIQGDDGTLQYGVTLPTTRFIDNGNTITDNLTGLMWTKDANLVATNLEKNWQNTLNYISGMNNGSGTYGYNDWRLPNIWELKSLINWEYECQGGPSGQFGNCQNTDSNVHLNSAGFTNIQNVGATEFTAAFPSAPFAAHRFRGGYWSSTTDPSDTSKAYTINLFYTGGVIGSSIKNNTGSPYPDWGPNPVGMLFWPVRTKGIGLSVNINPAGAGTVSKSINPQNNDGYDKGTDVILTPNPSGSSTFSGWTGCDVVSGNQCKMTMDDDDGGNDYSETVTANFTVSQFRTLNVSPQPNNGTIKSPYPCGGTGEQTCIINCPGDCSKNIAEGGSISLKAIPKSGYSFNSWGGDCSGTSADTCNLTMNADKTVSATFIQEQNISVTKKVINFGTLDLGLTATETITISNTGGITLSNLSITDTLSPFSIGHNCANSLEANASCNITLKFNPTSEGQYNGSFTITSNDPDSPSIKIYFTGKGISPTTVGGPDIHASSYNLNGFLNTSPGSGSPQTLTIKNYGSSDLTITEAKFTATDAAKFAITSGTCVKELGKSYNPVSPGGECTLTITYTASSTYGGPHLATLEIQTDDPNEKVVKFALIGSTIEAGNSAPDSKPVLEEPAFGSTTVTKIRFKWQNATDPTTDDTVDKGTLNHKLYFSTDPGFATYTCIGCLAAKESDSMYASIFGNAGGALVLLISSIVFGFILRKKTKYLVMFVIVAVLSSGLLLGSCSKKSTETTTTTEVQAGKTYYWKVIADDGHGGVSESDIYTFTTSQ